MTADDERKRFFDASAIMDRPQRRPQSPLFAEKKFG